MKPIDHNIENQIIGLPHRDRARLALALIESLDPGKDEDATELWLDEAERRLAAYDAGEIESRDADESLLDIERQLK
jgi:putative addiction module component (TIGR02574 family)